MKRLSPLKIITIYCLAGVAWVGFTDFIVGRAVFEGRTITLVQGFKGLFFVFVTAALLYVLIRRYSDVVIESEAKLRESEERYRAIFEQGTNAILLVDAETGELVDFNDRAHSDLGYAREEFQRLRLTDILAYDSVDKVSERIKHVVERGGDHSETQRKMKDGKLRTVLETTIPINISGKLYLLSVGDDITDRRRSEEERYRLATAVEQASEIIFITDRDGTIQYVNPSFERITGYRREEAVGENPRILKSGKQDQDFYKTLWDTINRGEVWKGRLINKKKDGGLYEEEATITPLRDAEGEVTNFVAVKRDVTNEMRLERQLRRAQKMEAIGTLAGGIAHDFNNILSAVIGYAQLVLDDVPKGTRMERNMQEVLNAGRRAKDLVKQILAFSREGEQAPLPIQLKPIVKEVLKLLRASLPSTIEIRENIMSDSIVQADPTQIHQVMMNLCANAAYAMQEKGGVLEVDLEDVDLDTVSADQCGDVGPGRFVRLCVCDTGRGVMPEVIERIFDPFFTTKKRGEGTGMGLAVVHGIVKDYGGTITVSSESGEGSTFHVYLPIVEAQVAEGFDADDAPVRGGNERILFVDDERPILESNKLILEHCGYHVTISESSIAALELFASNPDRVDVVITDMTMPKMTGVEMAREMIRIRPDLAVILCTGFSELVTEEKAKAAGIRAFVMKPLLKGKLLSTIRQVLEKS